MQIYFSSIPLAEGYDVLEQPIRHDRLVRGRRVDRPSGWALFHQLKGQPIRCWHCGVEADQWVASKGRNDKLGNAVLNLFATGSDGVVMMTRDHIIPRSLGGKDVVGNLRPGCAPCNETRSNEVSPEELRFAQEHPELVDEGRITRGLESLQTHVARLRRGGKQNEGEVARLEEPFRVMGYL